MLRDRRVRREHLAAVTRAFQATSTVHGVFRLRFVNVGWQYCQLALFLPVFLGVLSIFLYETVLTITDYCRYESQTALSYPVNDTISFPAITISSNNQFFRNPWGVNLLLYIPIVYSFHPSLPFVESGQMCSISGVQLPASSYDPTTNQSIFHTATKLGDVFSHYNNCYGIAMQLFHSNSENSLLNCRWQQQNINCSEVFHNHFIDVGYAFTFNPSVAFVKSYEEIPGSGFGTSSSALEKYKFDVSMPGKRSGLELLLFVNTEQYCDDGLQYTYGFGAAPHDRDIAPPMSYLEAIELLPGFAIDVAIGVSRIVKDPSGLPTWAKGYCLRERFFKMYPAGTKYTQLTCYIECMSNATISECSCFPQYAPPLGTSFAFHGTLFGGTPTPRVSMCQNTTEINCQNDVINNIYKYCDSIKCPHECDAISYTQTASASLFPAPNALPGILRQYNLNTSMTLAEFRKNYLLVTFYIDSMKYTRVDESQAITIMDLINSIGGALGLCLGASFISLAEIGTWLFDVINVLCRNTMVAAFGRRRGALQAEL